MSIFLACTEYAVPHHSRRATIVKSVCAFRQRYWSWVETRVAVNPITARHSDKRFQSRKNRRVNSRVKRREIARQRIVVGRFYCTHRSLRNCLLQA